MKMQLSSWFQSEMIGTDRVLLRAGRDARSDTEAISAAAYIVRSKDGSSSIRVVYSHTAGANKAYRFENEQADEIKVAATFIKDNSGRIYVLLQDEFGEGVDGRWVDKSLMVHPGSSRHALGDINAFAGRRILVPTAKALHSTGPANTTPPDLPVPGRPASKHSGNQQQHVRDTRTASSERRMSGHRNRKAKRHDEAPKGANAWAQAKATGQHRQVACLADL